MQAERALHLGYMYWANGTHPAGWRYPGATSGWAFDADYVVELARKAEDAKFDFFFLGDRLATGTEYGYTNTSVLASPEPLTLAGYLATNTSRIGLVVTANTTYSEPFNIARLTASLDHITAGRSAWNVVTGSDPRAATNFSRTRHGDAGERYDRADEFVSLVRQLWDSWEDGAFVRNKETGEFVNASLIHALNHAGRAFQVRGPLNLARPPQGHPVVLHAVTDTLDYIGAAGRVLIAPRLAPLREAERMKMGTLFHEPPRITYLAQSPLTQALPLAGAST